jgi:NADH dehydrogenase [ubiquinone] 1 alpha subcomplex assembly factor 5
MSDAKPFDRTLLSLRRDRAALCGQEEDEFVFTEAAERLLDRLDDVTRRFPLALDLGARGGLIGARLQGQGGIERLVACDLSPRFAGQALKAGQMALAADEELLPFQGAVFDLVLSSLVLHWVNDLPGALIQIRRALKPGGLFLASLLGGSTLTELRQCLLEAESEILGGAAPRVSPMASLRDLGGLMQRAGFRQPVVDSEILTVRYKEPFRLLSDLRAMGETASFDKRLRQPLRRDVLLRAMGLYAERLADAEGRVPASFEILTLTGWVFEEEA